MENSIDRANSISWDRPRSTAVKFDDDKETHKPLLDANFVRHDTPHPRELKARHQKLFNEKHQQTAEQQDGAANEVHRPQSRDQTARSDEEQSETSSVIVRTDAEIADQVAQDKRRRRIHSNRSDDGQDDCDSSLIRFEPSTIVSERRVNGGDRHAPVEVNESEDETDAAAFNERHVVFGGGDGEHDDEQEEDPERVERHAKLHRRDTPHHLKNKRINVAGAKADEDKVR